jgi:hypothetical protein
MNTDVRQMLQKVCADESQNVHYGILSSHPAAIMSALRAFGHGLEEVDVELIKEHARGAMDASPVDYVRSAALGGSLFVPEDSTAVSCAFTDFWVDHGEPSAVLEEVRKTRYWPLGENPEGIEYLVLIKANQDASKT